MITPQQYDAIIIGSGQAGTPLATTLAQAGMRTVLIEREHIGGTCVNEGCTPTKTMVASGRVAYLARRAADYGVNTGAISIDLGKVRQRERDIVESSRNGSQARLEKAANLDLIFGDASFRSQVGCRLLTRWHAASALSPDGSSSMPARVPRIPAWMASRTFRLSTMPPSWNSTLFPSTC